MQGGFPHKNILRVVDTDMNVERPYFVAEYCEGGSLANHPGKFRADLAAFEVARAIVEALQNAYIARLSAHRDVKPPNILFRKDGTPVLGDFGICHMEGDQRVTLTDEAMGSKDYIAPEMESGRRERVTSAVDVYALGKVIYWMLSGGHIFARESHRAPNLYLPNLLNDSRWEHVHGLLDQMVVAEASQRILMDEVPRAFNQTVQLIQGRYTALRPSVGLTCRFCGLGRYVKHEIHRGWIDALGLQNPRALRCSHCGSLEMFASDHIDDPKWWDR
jgi:serine/threonine protein kinase